jgi:hypothetical protein
VGKLAYATLTLTMLARPRSLMGIVPVVMNTLPVLRWPVVVRMFLMSAMVLSVLLKRS